MKPKDKQLEWPDYTPADEKGPIVKLPKGKGSTTLKEAKFVFEPHFHPYVCDLIRSLKSGGIAEMLDTSRQELKDDGEHFKKYDPKDCIDFPSADKKLHKLVDFSPTGAYSVYNWELFFHAPMLIANRLSKSQRFEEALNWYHFVFNPTDSSNEPSPKRFWKTLPFRKTVKESVYEMMMILSSDAPEHQQRKLQIIAEIDQWKDNPFQPHLVARNRITAYQKNVVMKYLDNIIAWADQLFMRDTIESINEASQLYVLAGHILGQRPRILPARGKAAPQTYASLRSKLDAFSNAIVNIENQLPFATLSSHTQGSDAASSVLGVGRSLYFGIPQNDKLLKYWDVVADRLYKIRHSMNIEGVVRQLPLFEPPIDPAMLVQAAAKGVDIGSVLSDLSTPAPHYRFTVMLQKAVEMCSELRALGGALLSAIEKRDAEELSSIRATHELNMLQLVKEVKKQQIEEAVQSKKALETTRQVTDIKYKHYNQIERISEHEQTNIDDLRMAQTFNQVSQGMSAAVSLAHLIPDFNLGASGWAGSPVATAMYGGNNLGNSLKAAQTIITMIASQYSHEANMASIKGGHDRRWNEWKLQEKMAKKELDQIDKQIGASELRIYILEKELSNHEQQIENSRQVEEYLRTKYSNEELYSWMQGEISTIYFQSYQLAYELAKRAEKAFRFERGITSSGFIQFGYWDSLRNGLLSGERLFLALKQMEKAYYDQNKREYEINRHISLALNNPLALLTLKATGKCEIDLPELFFDMDYPGHYMRRIRNISISIPCVVGPYTSINCTLTLLSSRVRKEAILSGSGYAEQPDDPRFIYNFGALQSITTSNAQNDSGMFELSFRDERFLPFEGSGAVSRWRIELPKDTNAFDFDSISDIIMHMRYTSREGGEALAKKARETFPQDGARLFDLRKEFPSEWHRFVTTPGSTGYALEFTLGNDRFSYFAREKTITVSGFSLFVKYKNSAATYYSYLNSNTDKLSSGTDIGKQNEKLTGFKPGGFSGLTIDKANGTKFTFRTTKTEQNFTQLAKDEVEDVFLLVNYSTQ